MRGVRPGAMLVEDRMAKTTRQRPRKRAEQQRAIETREAILNAAIAEFADKGFDGASIRAIADRLGLQHPLITYHYRTKDILWRAAAEHAFAQIRDEWDASAQGLELSPLQRLRREQGRRVARKGFYVLDILPPGTAFSAGPRLL